MERKISFSDVQQAVEEAYEQFKGLKDGAIDPRNIGAEAGKFGISVMLTDGRTVDKADTDILFPLGAIAKLPVSAILLSQNSPEELVKKSGRCCCHKKHDKPKEKMPLGRHGVRAISAIVPQNDPEGKYAVITDMLVGLAGSAAVINDQIYENYKSQIAQSGMLDKLAESGYKLYDEASIAVNTYAKLRSLTMSTKQLAQMGATVAADGRNPKSGEYAFDGKIAANVVAMMCTSAKHFIKPWLVLTGLPARKSFGGGILAILPGFGAIAAYSPELCENGVSVKAAKAIEYIAQKLGLNVFASARVEVE